MRNEKGKAIIVNSYSLLQDHFHEHMRDSGFLGFVRGERKSTREHLSDLEYKTQQEAERAKAEAERAAEAAAEVQRQQQAAAVLDTEIQGKAQTAAKMDAQAEKKQERLDKLTEAITVKDKAAATVAEIDAMGHSLPLVPGVHFKTDEAQTLKTLAKKGVTVADNTKELKQQLQTARSERDTLKAEKAAAQKAQPTISERLNWFDKFVQALRRAPKRLMAVIEDIMRQPPERKEQEQQQRTMPERKRSTGIEH